MSTTTDLRQAVLIRHPRRPQTSWLQHMGFVFEFRGAGAVELSRAARPHNGRQDLQCPQDELLKLRQGRVERGLEKESGANNQRRIGEIQ